MTDPELLQALAVENSTLATELAQARALIAELQRDLLELRRRELAILVAPRIAPINFLTPA